MLVDPGHLALCAVREISAMGCTDANLVIRFPGEPMHRLYRPMDWWEGEEEVRLVRDVIKLLPVLLWIILESVEVDGASGSGDIWMTLVEDVRKPSLKVCQYAVLVDKNEHFDLLSMISLVVVCLRFIILS